MAGVRKINDCGPPGRMGEGRCVPPSITEWSFSTTVRMRIMGQD